jgi:hypothetical protein
MQKVEGSSPFIRSLESPAVAGFVYVARPRRVVAKADGTPGKTMNSGENVAAVQSIFNRWQRGDFALDAFDAAKWDAAHMPEGEIYHRGLTG